MSASEKIYAFVQRVRESLNPIQRETLDTKITILKADLVKVSGGIKKIAGSYEYRQVRVPGRGKLANQLVEKTVAVPRNGATFPFWVAHNGEIYLNERDVVSARSKGIFAVKFYSSKPYESESMGKVSGIRPFLNALNAQQRKVSTRLTLFKSIRNNRVENQANTVKSTASA